MKIINPTQDFKTIDIVLANGERDSVNLQPQSRASLPVGAVIAPEKARVYASFLKTVLEDHDTPPVVESTVVSTVSPSVATK